MLAVPLAGCSTMSLKGQHVASTSRPAMAAAVQSPAPTVAAPVIPEGADFSTAVAMIAQTPGTGVVAVGKTPAVPEAQNTTALALAAIQPKLAPIPELTPAPAKPKKSASKKAPKVVVEAPAPAALVSSSDLPAVAPKTCPLDGTPAPGCVPAKTVLGEAIVPVKRF